jgi:hypothetical protein
MQRLLVILILILPFSAFSKTKATKLQICLAKEEQTIHKNQYGDPLFSVNRSMLGLATTFPTLKLKKNYLAIICANDSQSPAEKFLKLTLLKKYDLFSYSKRRSVRANEKSYSEDFFYKIPEIFFKYISDHQRHAHIADCFKKYIPEIPYFLEQFKYLQSEYSPEKLFAETNKLRKVFKSLDNFNDVSNKCLADKNARLKKIKALSK